ncbi:MAG: ATP-binding protein [Bacteroidales bacterium]|nr:ATP-binding protein [Bacteroidales bacterium]
MKIPFAYGKILEDRDFTARTEEIDRLKSNFQSLTNTIVVSPHRWGKSSLMDRTIKSFKSEQNDFLFVRLNIFKCETAQEFYSTFAKKIIEEISPSAESLLLNAKEFISPLLPKLTLTDPTGPYEITLGIDIKNNPIEDDALDLPQQIAKQKNKKLVICIDEFQQIASFPDTLKFQKTLRDHWHGHNDVAYILCGCKKHLMMNFFDKTGNPLNGFGDIMILTKISNEEWKKFLVGRFKDTGKSIAPDLAGYLAEQAGNHPYYVQQLAQNTWLRTIDFCSKDIVDEALQAMLNSLNLQFVNIMDSLTEKQRNFLCAVCDGVVNFSAIDTLLRYKLGTSGNIRIIKEALKKRDLIDETGKEIQIQDPIFKLWIIREYAKL